VKVLKKSIGGIDNIGLVIKLLDDVMIYSSFVNEKDLRDIKLNKIKIRDSIVGPYILSVDDKTIILSENSPEDLISILKKYFDLLLLPTKSNLLGNLFYIKRDILIFTKAYRVDVDIISNEVGLKPVQIKYKMLIPTTFKEYKDRLIISQILPDKIIDRIVSLIKPKKYSIGSVNFGSPYLKYGIEINEDYLIVGGKSTGHEIIKVEETFLK